MTGVRRRISERPRLALLGAGAITAAIVLGAIGASTLTRADSTQRARLAGQAQTARATATARAREFAGEQRQTRILRAQLERATRRAARWRHQARRAQRRLRALRSARNRLQRRLKRRTR